MSPFRRVLTNALVLCFAAAALGASAVRAQFYDPALRTLDLVSDVARSPRLLGMGGLSLVVPDRDNHLTLWDFAGSPLGAFGEDSVGTIELRPSTGSASGQHDLPLGLGPRQDLAGRMTSAAFEAFYRDHKGSAFGAVGSINAVRHDTPYSDGVEVRRSVSLPEVMPIFNGRFPHWGGGKLRYALRMRFGGEKVVDQYRTYVFRENGQYISLDGEILTSPYVLSPDEYKVSTSGIGGGLSYALGKSHTLALGIDSYRNRISGQNNEDRYYAERHENRPYTVGQATLVGRLSPSVQYGIDGRGWKSNSEESWYFSLSGGTGALPLTGRGKLLEREEEGSSLKSRVRVTSGRLEIGGDFWTKASKVTITPPDRTDPTSFNRFVAVNEAVTAWTAGDTVVANEIRDYAWGYGAGASLKLTRGILGAEWHWGRDLYNQSIAGEGPKGLQWDLRTGLEYECSPVVTGRVGYGYRWWDQDDFTALNEFKGHSTSLGLGIHPVKTSWSFEAGWTIGWHQSDYGDPTAQRGTRQLLGSQLNWTF